MVKEEGPDLSTIWKYVAVLNINSSNKLFDVAWSNIISSMFPKYKSGADPVLVERQSYVCQNYEVKEE